MDGTFKDIVIDETTHDEILRYFSQISKHQLSDELFKMVKSIPKSVVRLENLYDLHDIFKRAKNRKKTSLLWKLKS